MCTFFSSVSPISKRKTYLLSIAKIIDSNLLDYSDLGLTQILLFDDTSLDVNTNSSILNATIDFVISSKRFEEPLLKTGNFFFSTVAIFLPELILHPFSVYTGIFWSIIYIYIYIFKFILWFNQGH